MGHHKPRSELIQIDNAIIHDPKGSIVSPFPPEKGTELISFKQDLMQLSASQQLLRLLIACKPMPQAQSRVLLCRFAQQTASSLGSPEFLVPPVPALTRYKKEVAIKAAAADIGAPNTPPR